jgi:hypothetical protein
MHALLYLIEYNEAWPVSSNVVVVAEWQYYHISPHMIYHKPPLDMRCRLCICVDGHDGCCLPEVDATGFSGAMPQAWSNRFACTAVRCCVTWPPDQLSSAHEMCFIICDQTVFGPHAASW